MPFQSTTFAPGWLPSQPLLHPGRIKILRILGQNTIYLCPQHSQQSTAFTVCVLDTRFAVSAPTQQESSQGRRRQEEQKPRNRFYLLPEHTTDYQADQARQAATAASPPLANGRPLVSGTLGPTVTVLIRPAGFSMPAGAIFPCIWFPCCHGGSREGSSCYPENNVTFDASTGWRRTTRMGLFGRNLRARISVHGTVDIWYAGNLVHRHACYTLLVISCSSISSAIKLSTPVIWQASRLSGDSAIRSSGCLLPFSSCSSLPPLGCRWAIRHLMLFGRAV